MQKLVLNNTGEHERNARRITLIFVKHLSTKQNSIILIGHYTYVQVCIR